MLRSEQWRVPTTVDVPDARLDRGQEDAMPTQSSFSLRFGRIRRGMRVVLEVGFWLSAVGTLLVIARDVLARGL